MKIKPRKQGFGNITEVELKFIQRNLLDLLLEFDELCRRHNIVYYLDGGSVIGALRHGGFIPWDDDVDILIKRSEFDKLLGIIDSELAERPKRVFSYMGRRSRHHHPFARYVNTDVLHIIRSSITEATYPPGIFLDIFILDPVPAAKLDDHLKKLERSEEWFHKYLNGVLGSMPYWQYICLGKIEKRVGETRIFRFFERQLAAYDDDDADYYVPRNGFNYAVYDTDVFREPTYVNFEGHSLPAPTMPEKFLRTHYSIDWFNLPPPETRYSDHVTLTSDEFSVGEFLRQSDFFRQRRKVRAVQGQRHKCQIRRKPWLSKMARCISEFNATLDELECARFLGGIAHPWLDELLSRKQYERIAELFEPFYARQLKPGYRGNKLALKISQDQLHAALVALVEVGRFYDADRILSIHESNGTSMPDVREMVDAAQLKEVEYQDDPSTAKPVFRDVSAVPTEEIPDEARIALQTRQMTLLDEVDALCTREDIDYSLTGNLLIDAVRYGQVSDTYTEVEIAMTAPNYLRFIGLGDSLPEGRALENIFTNRYYPGTSVRYVDTTTTHFAATEPWYALPGVHVVIRLLFNVRNNRRRRIIKKLAAFGQNSYTWPPTARYYCTEIGTWLHRRHMRKILAQSPGYIKMDIIGRPRKIALSLSAADLENYVRLDLDGRRYKIFSCLPSKLRQRVPWFSGLALQNRISDANQLLSLDVPCSEFASRIPRRLLRDFKSASRRASEIHDEIKIIEKSKYSHRRFLFNVAYHFTRYKLHVRYRTRKHSLIAALADNDHVRLEGLLQEYINQFNYFFQHNRVLVFDPTVFAMFLELLRHQGRGEFADYISAQVVVSDYKHNDPPEAE